MQVVIERRPTLFFIVVLGLLFLLMSVSGQTRYMGETRTLFERTFMTVFSPVPAFVNWIGRGTADIYHGYVDMRHAVNENLHLHRQVASLTTDNLKLRQSEGDLRRLRTLLGYSEQFNMPTTMALPIMIDTSGRFKSILIDRGSSSDVQVNDAVVNASGLVGRVVLTTKDLAKVQLLTDGDCSVGTIVERTRRQGVVRGDGSGAQMFDVPAREDIQPGDTVMTGGIDGIFPKGILVGTVVRAEEGKGLFKIIWIHPAVDTANLEEVIVLHTRKIPPEVVRYSP